MEATPTNKRVVLLTALLLLLVVVGGMLSAGLMFTTRKNNQALSSTAAPTVNSIPLGHVVYFAGMHPDAIPYSQADLKAAGVQIVFTFDDLRTSIFRQTIAILLDQDTLRQTDAAWLIDQYQQGRVIAGFNINVNELREVVPRSVRFQSSPPWQDYPPDKPHFSIIYECNSHGGETQDHFAAWRLSAFLNMIQPDSCN